MEIQKLYREGPYRQTDRQTAVEVHRKGVTTHLKSHAGTLVIPYL